MSPAVVLSGITAALILAIASVLWFRWWRDAKWVRRIENLILAIVVTAESTVICLAAFHYWAQSR